MTQQYVFNPNGEVDIFLPDGKIATSSILWNTEINKLKELGNPVINYFRLTGEAAKLKIKVDAIQEELNKIIAEIEEFEKEHPDNFKIDIRYIKLKAGKRSLEEQINAHKSELQALCKVETNWEKVPVEKIKFKGINIEMGPMLKIAQRLASDKAKQRRKMVLATRELKNNNTNKSSSEAESTPNGDPQKRTPPSK